MRTKPPLLGLVTGSAVVVGAFLGLAILANAFAAYFVAQENYVYYWDSAGYWVKYVNVSTSLVHDPVSALGSLIRAVRRSDYNPLPVLPLVPFAWLFGTSRLTYWPLPMSLCCRVRS